MRATRVLGRDPLTEVEGLALLAGGAGSPGESEGDPLEDFKQFWTILDHFKQFWTILDNFLTILSNFGPSQALERIMHVVVCVYIYIYVYICIRM